MDTNDKEKDRQQTATEWGTMISMLATAISLALDSLSILPGVRWSVFALIAFFIFCFLVWKWFSGLNSELDSRTPNIDLIEDPIIIKDVGMSYNVSLPNHSVSIYMNTSCISCVGYSNKPKHRTDKNSVEMVRAEISCYDENNNILLKPIEGRWEKTEQPSHISGGEARAIESIDFPNNGAVRVVDLFMKYPEDDYCYAYNNESYDHTNYQNPAFVISAKRFFVIVELIGSYLPAKQWKFEVETEGKGDTFRMRKMGGKWIKIENSKATKKWTPLAFNPAEKKASLRKRS